MTAQTFNLKGEKLKETTLPEELFGLKVKPIVLAQAVRVYLSNIRAGSAKTKTRAEVAKTTAKMFKQKGTGKARHGSWAAPIFVGGGIAHGPDGLQNYKLKFPEAMRKLAMKGALSVKAADKKVCIVAGAEEASGKTKEIAQLVKKAGLDRVLVVTGVKQKQFNRAIKNLDGITQISVGQLNTYTILKYRNLLITKEALGELKKVYVD